MKSRPYDNKNKIRDCYAVSKMRNQHKENSDPPSDIKNTDSV